MLFYKVDKKAKVAGQVLLLFKKIVEVHIERDLYRVLFRKGCTACFTVPQAEDVYDTSDSGNKNYCGVNINPSSRK